MKCVDDLQHPRHCFCQVSVDLLSNYFHKRYVEGVTTMELLAKATSEEEREVVCIVAAFEVEESVLLSLMSDVRLPDHHILHCREAFKDKLENIEESKKHK